MDHHRFRVGIVGLQPERSWAAFAHLPALRHLADDFEIVGVANSTLASAQAAATACSIPRAFASMEDMVASPDIDIVAVTVKVPAHWDLVLAAVNAGKHVYCEWPLGRTLDEAVALAKLAADKGVLAVTGTQARVTPAMRHLRQLVKDGFVGNILSTTMTGRGRIWGATIDDLKTDGYLLDNANGATLLTIPFAHSLAVLRDVLGDLTEVSALLDTRYKQVLATETGEMVPMDAPDQILVTGRLYDDATVSIHYQGGEPRGVDGFVWDIHGSDGDLRVTAATGHTQILPLTISGGRGEDRTLQPIVVPDDGLGLDDYVPGNVARIYKRMAADLRNGTHTAPTFDDAVNLHRVLAAIETSSRVGCGQVVDAPNQVLQDF
ncbi:Gfo/Idh/MocA family oxidoreductase [Agrobacterium sp. Ap1]|uniref:Gfo/Idh/MocA family protein n=1 Tax=Agrobacterium sp. Ap1 TaxID=2815337 RepID=UPI001A8CDD1D|nr:Gfo/Idh/MocA family oxidoreductase [Agrobacterium sp. Ap1]MBO0144639.1 Gfo/Idh/MocA family oxidoreductase [Agrobacterium sp. Ap1]